MKNSLSNTGLSLNQAQSISNMCNQRALEIERSFEKINNYSKTITFQGNEYIQVTGFPLSKNYKDLLLEKAKLHACQSFLMVNLKQKDETIKSLMSKAFNHDLTPIPFPIYQSAKLNPKVNEEWGWNQLSLTEINEYLEHEAFAAHIGQFIHNGGILSDLRNQLPELKELEWFEIETGRKTPVIVNIHHTSEQLLNVHEELSLLHREHNARVNYFKAKVKNLVTEENARITKENGIEESRVNEVNQKLRNDYQMLFDAQQGEINKLKQEFENLRELEIQVAAKLRIQVDPRYQSTIDKYMPVKD